MRHIRLASVLPFMRLGFRVCRQGVAVICFHVGTERLAWGGLIATHVVIALTQELPMGASLLYNGKSLRSPWTSILVGEQIAARRTVACMLQLIIRFLSFARCLLACLIQPCYFLCCGPIRTIVILEVLLRSSKGCFSLANIIVTWFELRYI